MDTPFSDLANNGAIPSGVALLFSLNPRQLRMQALHHHLIDACLLPAVALSLIHISEPTRQAEISYAVFCLKKKNSA